MCSLSKSYGSSAFLAQNKTVKPSKSLIINDLEGFKPSKRLVDF
jgi:hypothetical protein